DGRSFELNRNSRADDKLPEWRHRRISKFVRRYHRIQFHILYGAWHPDLRPRNDRLTRTWSYARTWSFVFFDRLGRNSWAKQRKFSHARRSHETRVWVSQQRGH